MLKTLYNISDKTKNNQFVNVIKSGLRDLKDEIKKMSEDEINIEKPYKIVILLKRFLNLIDNNIRDMA